MDARRDYLDRETALIQQRIKWWRLSRKLSQQVVADRAGIDRTYLSKIEAGTSRLDSRSTIDAIARALNVSYAELTGQPVRPETPDLQAAHAGIDRIRVAHLAGSLTRGADVDPRPLELISPEVEAAADAWQECDYAAAARRLGPVISELYAHTAAGRIQALPLLVSALDTATWTARVLGHSDLAHALTGREIEAAHTTEDRRLIGWAHFTTSLMVAAAGTGHEPVQAAARRVAEKAITELGAHASTSEDLEMLGMLHLAAARAGIAAGGDAESPLREAEALAQRTGEGNLYRLQFGPTNVAIWRIHLAQELHEGGRAGEYAQRVRPEAIRTRARRSMFYRHLGLALAQDRGRERESVQALLRAERTAPGKLRLDPLARHTIEHMLARVRAAAGGNDLLTLARQVGVI